MARHVDPAALVADQIAVTRQYLDGALDAARAMEEAIADDGAELPIAWLRQRLGLTASEERLLWVLIAHELSPEVRQQLRALGEPNGDLSVDVLRRVVYGARAEARAWRELAPDGPLRRYCLIDRVDGGANGPLHKMRFRIARRVLALAHGDAALDDELAAIALPAADRPSFDELAVNTACATRVLDWLAHATGIAILYGRPGTGRRSLWLAAAHEAGRAVLALDARRLALDLDAATRQLRVIARECRLLAVAPLVLHLDALGGSAVAADRFPVFEAELGGSVLATARRPIARRWQIAPELIELPPLTNRARVALWQRALPAASLGDAELLAAMYPLAPALICDAGELAVRAAAHDAEMQPEHIEGAIRAALDDRFGDAVTRIGVAETWTDLVVPDEQTTALLELLARIREHHRVYDEWGFGEKINDHAGHPRGAVALFSGPAGTGKTMCAGLIARELGTELYRVDLARPSAQSVAELLETAEAGHAVLLFEDAEELFGARAADAELLHCFERFSGICILTTRQETAIGDAFRRRIAMHIRFPMPSADQRAKLWGTLLPDRAPRARDLRLAELARTYVMSGGQIRSAILRAAFLAADEDTEISRELLVSAAEIEYEATRSSASR